MISSSAQYLLIRADANAEIGVGHVMRCLALAQAWQDMGGEVVLAYASLPHALVDRLLDEGLQMVSLQSSNVHQEEVHKTLSVAREYNADWIVTDGYQFDADYHRIIKNGGYKLLIIDDNGHAGHYCGDIIINQNLSADESLYFHREPESCLLLGTRYALLRREFWSWRGWHRELPETARKILVTMGGSDIKNVTLTVLKALVNLNPLNHELKVILGAGNPHTELLDEETRSNPCIDLVKDTREVPSLMAWADLAVSAGGSTSWELAFMGLPSLIIIVADNQIQIANSLDQKGISINLGRFDDIQLIEKIEQSARFLITSIGARRKMCELSQELVDGHGAIRVVESLINRKN